MAFVYARVSGIPDSGQILYLMRPVGVIIHYALVLIDMRQGRNELWPLQHMPFHAFLRVVTSLLVGFVAVHLGEQFVHDLRHIAYNRDGAAILHSGGTDDAK